MNTVYPLKSTEIKINLQNNKIKFSVDDVECSVPCCKWANEGKATVITKNQSYGMKSGCTFQKKEGN